MTYQLLSQAYNIGKPCNVADCRCKAAVSNDQDHLNESSAVARAWQPLCSSPQ